MQMTLRYAHLAPSHKVAAISLLDGDPNPPPVQNYTVGHFGERSIG